MILVTGGTGLLGGHLLCELAKTNKVKALYRNKGKLARVQQLFEFYCGEDASNCYSNIEWVEGDILDIPSLDAAMKDVTLVYHCAALVSFARSDFHQLVKVNKEGTANVVNLALKHGVKKLCYVSSTAALGGNPGVAITEADKWTKSDHTSGYSISKHLAEQEVWRGVEEGIDAVIINPSLIVGAGSWNDSSLAIFKTVSKGLRFYTSGANALVDARDLATIMVRLMNSDIKNDRFLCAAENIPLKDLLSLIASKIGKRPPSIAVPDWMMGVTWRIFAIYGWIRREQPVVTKDTTRHATEHLIYDASKIRKALDFKFRTTSEMVDNAVAGRLD
ncbi:MAG: NAD-dependent epimerase/dehydratase family protein [Bacteroidota bacterium]